MEHRLTVTEDAAIMPQTFEGMMKQAEVLVKSGLLPAEIKSAAAAVAIMLTGRELSVPPMQAFRSIYVVKGKPTLSAQLMGALIFRAGHSYSVVESTNEKCTIEYKRKSGETYRHTFTIEDAGRAGLKDSPTWRQYPKAMLFSRCMSAGARAFMPDVIAGMYTPEELAGPVPVDPETGEIIAHTSSTEAAIDAEYTEAPADCKAKPERPYDAETVRKGVHQRAASGGQVLATEGHRGYCVSLLEGLFADDEQEVRDAKRWAVTDYLLGKPHSKDWTAGEVTALCKWVEPDKAIASAEAERILAAHKAEHVHGGLQPDKEDA